MKFEILTTKQLLEKFKKYNYKQVHVHHTYRPKKSDYKGTDASAIKLQQAMKNFHVNSRGFSDIAQHVTLLPDGRWVTGRSFSKDPASIKGWNDGAFCIEMLGDFDKGNDKLEGKQLEAIIELCAFYIKLGKEYSQIKFHRENAAKSCPGTGIDKTLFINLVKNKVNPPKPKPTNPPPTPKPEPTPITKERIVEEMSKYFKDVLATSSHAKNIDALHEKGIINGHADGTFKPNDPVTRGQVATMLNKAIEYVVKKLSK